MSCPVDDEPVDRRVVEQVRERERERHRSRRRRDAAERRSVTGAGSASGRRPAPRGARRRARRGRARRRRRRAAGPRATPGRDRGCASARPTTTRRRRRASSSIVTDAAFCISDRNRATSSPATSQRRRSVRSRTLSTRLSPSGAPIISTRRQPSALRTRSSSRRARPPCACTLVSASAASWRSSGWMKSRPFAPIASVDRDAEEPLGRGVRPAHGRARVDHQHGVGERPRDGGERGEVARARRPPRRSPPRRWPSPVSSARERAPLSAACGRGGPGIGVRPGSRLPNSGTPSVDREGLGGEHEVRRLTEIRPVVARTRRCWRTRRGTSSCSARRSAST